MSDSSVSPTPPPKRDTSTDSGDTSAREVQGTTTLFYEVDSDSQSVSGETSRIMDRPLLTSAETYEAEERRDSAPEQFYGTIDEAPQRNNAAVSGVDLLRDGNEILALRRQNPYKAFFRWPLYRDIMVANSVTEARDLLMSERNYLSGLKMALQLCAVGAIMIANVEFINDSASGGGDGKLPPRVSYGIGAVFVVLGIIGCILVLLNYAKAVIRYAAYESVVVTSRSIHALVILGAVVCLATNIYILAEGGST